MPAVAAIAGSAFCACSRGSLRSLRSRRSRPVRLRRSLGSLCSFGAAVFNSPWSWLVSTTRVSNGAVNSVLTTAVFGAVISTTTGADATAVFSVFASVRSFDRPPREPRLRRLGRSVLVLGSAFSLLALFAFSTRLVVFAVLSTPSLTGRSVRGLRSPRAGRSVRAALSAVSPSTFWVRADFSASSFLPSAVLSARSPRLLLPLRRRSLVLRSPLRLPPVPVRTGRFFTSGSGSGVGSGWMPNRDLILVHKPVFGVATIATTWGFSSAGAGAGALGVMPLTAASGRAGFCSSRLAA